MSDRRLYPELLIQAYGEGYFPMPDPETGELLWFRPDPRAVIPLDGFHCSRSLMRRIRRGDLIITFDKNFRGVMEGCANRPETWITPEFHKAYGDLHDRGVCHSVEVWKDSQLVGGVYGLALNGAFFAESKFHTETDASKIALYFLVKRLREKGFSLLEVQFLTPHLARLGAIKISDVEYQKRLQVALRKQVTF